MKLTIENLQAAWKRGGKNGGKARAAKLSAKRKREIARLGGLAKAARRKKIPKIAA